MPSALMRPRPASGAGGRASSSGAGRWTGAIRGRQRPVLFAASVTVAVLAAIVGIWQLNAAWQRLPVLVMARAIPVGTVIQDADLAVAEVYVDAAVAHVTAAQRPQLVGKIATADLAAGALLAPGQIGDVTPPSTGQALVVVAVPASRIPAIGLRPGDSILVVSTPAAQADVPAGQPASVPATIVRVGVPDADSSLTPIDVVVAASDGPTVAARAATGRVAIVVLPHHGA